MVGHAGTSDGLVVQDQVPARPGIDYVWWRFAGDDTIPDALDWCLINSLSLAAGKRNGYKDSDNSVLLVCCRPSALPAKQDVVQSSVESPDDWVPLTDKKHVLRRDIDWIVDTSGIAQDKYERVQGYAGRTLGWAGVDARCLRKHHPDFQAKPVEPQTFRVGDTVCIRGTREVTLVNYVAKDGLVRLESRLNPAYWFNPAVLDLVSRSEQSFPMLPADRKAVVTEPVHKEVDGLESARKHLDSLPEWQREALFKGYGLR